MIWKLPGPAPRWRYVPLLDRGAPTITKARPRGVARTMPGFVPVDDASVGGESAGPGVGPVGVSGVFSKVFSFAHVLDGGLAEGLDHAAGASHVRAGPLSSAKSRAARLLSLAPEGIAAIAHRQRVEEGLRVLVRPDPRREGIVLQDGM